MLFARGAPLHRCGLPDNTVYRHRNGVVLFGVDAPNTQMRITLQYGIKHI